MLKFKISSLQSEFCQLKVKNAPLAAIIEDLADFVAQDLQKDVVITHIFRKKETQKEIYGAQTKKVSPHEVWQAVDIRDWIYTPGEKAAIIKVLKEYDRSNWMRHIIAANSKTVWLHQVQRDGKDFGMHFHIQYSGPLVYRFNEPMVITALQR